jgi:hypothetical protein
MRESEYEDTHMARSFGGFLMRGLPQAKNQQKFNVFSPMAVMK